MPQPTDPRPKLPPLTGWAARLRAWPGLLTLLSVLAVVVGQQAPAPAEGTSGPRVAAAPAAPALPELRAAPAPTPAPGLLTAPPPEPLWAPAQAQRRAAPATRWTAPSLPRSLALLGRRQTDGG